MAWDSTTRAGVAIGGFMGTGKTSVGRRLAAVLGLPFVDSDAVLVERHGPIDAQLRAGGEAAFRAREAAVIAEIADGPPAVLATGGGVFADAASRARLRRFGWLLTLDAPLPVLRLRVGAAAGRPLFDDRVAGRLAARRDGYADVDATFDADRPLAAVVAEIAAWLAVARDVPCRVGEARYPVAVRPGLDGLGAAVRRATGARTIAVVTDRTVADRWLLPTVAALRAGGLRVLDPIVIRPGEAHKTVATWAGCVDALLERGVARDVPVVALGGGVVGDLAGFAAATTLRGLPLVQVPTTLLAMVDSAVGGKVAVDHPRGKNLVGAFHHPALVWAPLRTLDTLPAREVRAGLAEIVKIALVADAGLFEALEAGPPPRGLPALAALVARAVALKAAIVHRDPREDGERALLNLGHTLGHGVEVAAGYGAILHGEAVAVGMVAEARAAARLGLAPPALADRIAAVLGRLGLPSDLADAAALVSRPLSADAVASAVGLDKKRRGAMLRWPVARAPGAATIVEVTVETFLRASLPDR
jgi:shikimate kinase/3-dehydroquinate synthase